MFAEEEGSISISVIDDGTGLLDQHENGNGLKGMKERLALINGTLKIRSNKGTALKITIPIVKKQTEVKDVYDTYSHS